MFKIYLFYLINIQLCNGESRYCKEAVDTVKNVESCPTSKTEWDTAALNKDCSKIALQQNCSTVEKFVYHCVINGYRNKLLEVCAPSRLILGKIFLKHKYIVVLSILGNFSFLNIAIYKINCTSYNCLFCFRKLCRVQWTRWSDSRSNYSSLQRDFS